MKNINKTILFTGCMFSGKSLNLINATLDLKKSYQCFKPDIDNRDGDFIVSRDLEIKLPAKRTKNLFEVLNSKSKAIIFDEIQFFDENDFEEIILKLKKMNKTILMSGLDRIATGKFWETYKVAEKLADEIIKLTAVCDECGGIATYTKKISGTNSEIEIEGDGVKYIPVCEKCFYKN